MKPAKFSPNPTGSIYVDNFTGTLGLSFSGGALCATVPGVDLIPGVTNPICI